MNGTSGNTVGGKPNGKMNDFVKATLDSVKSLVESNTVIGEPMETAGGTVVIPVSKISVGFASGGIDYPAKKSESQIMNFGGGGGTGVGITPIGFLIVKKDGNVEMLNIADTTGDSVVNRIASVGDIIEKSPEILQKLKDVITSKKKTDKETIDPPSAPAEKA